MTDEMKAKSELLFSSAKTAMTGWTRQTLDAMEAYCRDLQAVPGQRQDRAGVHGPHRGAGGGGGLYPL